MYKNSHINVEHGDDAGVTPTRVAYVKSHTSIAVERDRDDEVMTFPHLLVREVLTFYIMMILLVLCSLFFDAPLEGIANPEHSPNPSKAPWYFLGLQELLHYFPPFVAGVLLPALVVIALVVIPYFQINWTRESLWIDNIRKRFLVLSVIFLLFNVYFIVKEAIPIYVSSATVYTIMVLPLIIRREHNWLNRIRKLALADWIMIWFVLVSTVLIVIGVFFRGPEWRWIWPWIDGIYY